MLISHIFFRLVVRSLSRLSNERRRKNVFEIKKSHWAILNTQQVNIDCCCCCCFCCGCDWLCAGVLLCVHDNRSRVFKFEHRVKVNEKMRWNANRFGKLIIIKLDGISEKEVNAKRNSFELSWMPFLCNRSWLMEMNMTQTVLSFRFYINSNNNLGERESLFFSFFILFALLVMLFSLRFRQLKQNPRRSR